MRKSMVGAAVLTVGIWTMSAQAQSYGTPPAPPPSPGAVAPLPPLPPHPPMMMAMANMPKTRAEAQAAVHEQFAQLDANKDGFVTRDELPRMPPHQPMGAHPPMPPMPGHGLGPDSDRMFAMMDKDGNGQISKAEFDAAHKGTRRSVEVTKDKDGHEIRRERVIVMNGPGDGPPPPPPPGVEVSTDKDGHTIVKERRMVMRGAGEGPPPPPGMGMARLHGMMLALRFDTIDTNHDGKLSLAELETSALARFDKIDADHNGTLTAAEIESVTPRVAMRIKRLPMQRGIRRGPGYDLPADAPVPPVPPAPPAKM